MAWAKPIYSKKEITRAGKVLIDPDSSPESVISALDIVNNWRACHHYPINTFQANLRKHLNGLDKDALVGQRLKRVSSIVVNSPNLSAI